MTYDQIEIGQRAQFSKTVTETDLAFFCAITGDYNPIHIDTVAASESRFGSRIVHGMLSGSLFCSVYGMQLPGPGTIHLEQSLRFLSPVRIGDTVTAHVEVIEMCGKGRVRVSSWCTIQDGTVVIEGTALLRAPHDQPRGR